MFSPVLYTFKVRLSSTFAHFRCVNIVRKSRERKPTMTFGEKIKQERLKRGMDQKHFAALIGVSFRTVQNYETKNVLPRKILCCGKTRKILRTDFSIRKLPDCVVYSFCSFTTRRRNTVTRPQSPASTVYRTPRIPPAAVPV